MPLPSQVHIPSIERDFTIQEKDGKWCLISGEGKVLGCHDSKAGAEAQERAVNSNKARLSREELKAICEPCEAKMAEKGIVALSLDLSRMDMGVEFPDGVREAVWSLIAKRDFGLNETHNIKGVEIFSVGEWNGDRYTGDDLDELEATFKDTKPFLRPYLKIGHGDDQGLLKADELPAAGYISDIYRRGDKLIADFERMPRKIFDLVAAGAYDKLSCEIYANVKVGGKRRRLALKAISLLGGDTPAVENLDAIRALYSKAEPECDGETKVRAHQYSAPKEDMAMQDCPAKLEEMKKEMEAYKQKHMAAEAEAKKFADENASLKASAESVGKEVETLKNAKAELEKKFSEASEKIAKVELEKRESEIETRVNTLVTEKKVLPAQKAALKALLLNAKGVQKFKLGEKEEFEGEEALILAFVSKGGSRLPTDESSEQGKTSKAERHSPEFVKEVEAYAEANKLSFKAAYVKMTSAPEPK